VKSSRSRDFLAWALVLLGLVGIAKERAPLAKDFHGLRMRADVYALPPVEQTYLASLGYRSALADLILGHVLVSYGLHFQEKRLFEYVGEYLETIIRLDPSFRTPYLMADTLLTLEPEAPPQEFYRKARRIQDQGLREFPGDQELWNTSGQFLAYLAPSYLTDFDEKMEYRREGARRLMRACELIGSNDNVPYHCITAANLLSEQGNREAMRQFLERVANTSDDPRIQELASGYLRKVIGAEEAERAAARAARFNTAWKTDLSFVPRSEIHAIGPSFDSAACAGITVDPRPGCATSWLFWAESAESSVAP
jgi:hypothetical protein